MISARRAAYDALTAVIRNGAYTSLALKEHIPSALPQKDKAFASLLVRTTLENLLRIDYVIGKFIKAGRVHGSVKNILRLGACQILYTDTEDYAAVSESVDLAKQIKPQTSGFVNAVLRSLINGKDAVEFPQDENTRALSILTSYPAWICEKYIKDFGYDFTKELLSYKESPGVSVRVNTLISDSVSLEKEFDELGLEYSNGKIDGSYTVRGFSDIENTEVYKKGHMAVQSESAMRAVIEAGIEPGMKVLDCCAAPGGKSAYAAALAGNSLDITAWDIHKHRLGMMDKNFERLGVRNAKTELCDASVPKPEYESAFDTVIVDAPCSAMGLMAKSPDIRYSRKQEDIKALAAKQHEILSVCAKYVKPGGKLAYFTCSINKEENEEVTDGFITGNNDFEYLRKPQTIYPHISGSDGFYIAVMKRKYE